MAGAQAAVAGPRSARLPAWFQRAVLSRRWVTFIVMGLAFFVFGASSVNLFFLLKANTQFLAEHGWMAAMDGGLRQLVELLATGYLSVAAYVMFKACEHALVHHLCDAPAPHPTSDKTP